MFKSFRKLKFITKDDKGQIFSIDALFALVIITVVIGMSANAMDITVFKISDYQTGRSLDRIATDAADILINTPGSLDWEKNNITSGITPGLVQDSNGSTNSTKILSLDKISQLKTNYDELMGNILPVGWSSSVTIYPVNPNQEIIKISNKTPSEDVSEVAVVNRTVLVNLKNFKVLLCIDKSNNSDICPHHNCKKDNVHNKPNYNKVTPGWNCKCFKITQNELNVTDFYILTDPSLPNDNLARWAMDRSDNITDDEEIFQAQPVLVNDKICKIIGDDDETIVWLHTLTSGDPSKSFDTYLVGVPKGTSTEEVRVEYLNPQLYFFILNLIFNDHFFMFFRGEKKWKSC